MTPEDRDEATASASKAIRSSGEFCRTIESRRGTATLLDFFRSCLRASIRPGGCSNSEER